MLVFQLTGMDSVAGLENNYGYLRKAVELNSKKHDWTNRCFGISKASAIGFFPSGESIEFHSLYQVSFCLSILSDYVQGLQRRVHICDCNFATDSLSLIPMAMARAERRLLLMIGCTAAIHFWIRGGDTGSSLVIGFGKMAIRTPMYFSSKDPIMDNRISI